MPNDKQEDRPQSQGLAGRIAEFGEDVILFCDDHAQAIKIGVGVAVALGTAAVSGPAAIAIGAAAAGGMAVVSSAVHGKAQAIRKERAEKAALNHDEKSDEKAKGKGLENSQQLEQGLDSSDLEPINKGRHPHPEENIHYHNHHAAEVKAHQQKASKVVHSPAA